MYVCMYAPLHPQKITILRVNCNVTISRLHIKFGHKRPRLVLCNHANNLVNLNVVHGKFVRTNSIVYAGPVRRWQVHNKVPLAGLTFLGDYPKAAYLYVWQRN